MQLFLSLVLTNCRVKAKLKLLKGPLYFGVERRTALTKHVVFGCRDHGKAGALLEEGCPLLRLSPVLTGDSKLKFLRI